MTCSTCKHWSDCVCGLDLATRDGSYWCGRYEVKGVAVDPPAPVVSNVEKRRWK